MTNPPTNSADLIILERVNGNATVEGVPLRKVRHSPTGWEWGYGGSGPADLALNILLECGATEAEAEEWYQSFKAAVIVQIPFKGGRLSKSDIRRKIEHLRANPMTTVPMLPEIKRLQPTR